MVSLVSLTGWAATAWSSKALRVGVLAAAVGLALWRFHSWSAETGRNACELAHAEVLQEERERQASVVAQAVESAEVRAAHAERRLRELSALADQVASVARAAPEAGQVCLGMETVDALRNLN